MHHTAHGPIAVRRARALRSLCDRGVDLSSPATPASPVGAYDLNAANATGSGLSNYAISDATNVGGLAVTPQPLTVTANDDVKSYDG